MTYLKTDPASVLTIDDNKTAVITLGDPARMVTVTDLSQHDVRDLEWEVPMLYDGSKHSPTFWGVVFNAIADLDQDLVTKRELEVKVVSYFDDAADAIKLADSYRRYTVDNDEEELIDDVIGQALDHALAYLSVCGCVSAVYNSNSKMSSFDPRCGYFLTKMGHVLKQMLYGTNAKVSI